MTKHLAAAVGSVLLTAVPPRPGIAETTIAPVVQETGHPAGVGVIRIALDPQDHGIGRSAAAAMTAQAGGRAPPERPPAAQGSPRVTFEPSGGDFLITVQMEGASRATLRQDGREVLVSFPHPLPDFNAQTLQDQAVGLLEGVNVGFDTLLLRLTPGVTVTRMDEAGGLRLVVQPEAGAAGAAAPPGEPITRGEQGRRTTPAPARRPAAGPERTGLRRPPTVRRPDPGDAGEPGADERARRPRTGQRALAPGAGAVSKGAGARSGKPVRRGRHCSDRSYARRRVCEPISSTARRMAARGPGFRSR